MRYILILLFSCAIQALAQQPSIEKSTPKTIAAAIAEIKRAGVLANVDVGEGLIKGFERTAGNQADAYTTIYTNVPQDKRVSRLADYLAVKHKSKVASVGYRVALSENDLRDFHWSYLSRDFTYHPIRFEGASYANLDSVEIPGLKMVYGFWNVPFENGAVFVLPKAPYADNKYVTVTLDARNSKLLWTGDADAGTLLVATSSTSRGCEIDVKSQPPGATVMFNGRIFHNRTNTRSVRDPGRYEVTIQLDGHKEWREEKFLEAGASWSIDVNLEKR